MDPRQYPDSIKRRRGVGNRKGGATGGSNRVKPDDNIKKQYLADRIAFVAEQILLGKRYREIADELGVSVRTIHEDHYECIRATKAKNSDELRDRFNARYDALYAAHIDAAQAGNVRSGELCLKVTMAQARLNGAELPQKHELTGKDGGPIQTVDVTKLSDDELERMARGDSGPAGAPGEGGAGAP